MNSSIRSTLTFEDVAAAAERLRDVAQTTPVLHLEAFDRQASNTLFIKCENLQRMGAFKFRGAYNRLSQLTDEERRRGVVAYSSGNHAQGVALAAKLLGISATIVMPADAPGTKLESTRALGANVITYNRQTESREEIAARTCEEMHSTLVPPFDDLRIMAGQGTVALELCREIPDLDSLLVPLGGGGLLSGCAVAARHERPEIVIYGVEPQAGNDWQQSFRAGERVTIDPPDTIADGLLTTAPGELTWPIVHELVHDVVTVSDSEIRKAMRCVFESARLIVEPSGAVGVAAALFGKTRFAGKRVGVIISGGNVDMKTYCQLIEG